MEVLRKPAWLKSKKLGARKTREIIKILRKYNLHTVCESAKCPNQGECFENGTATFMILGETCTRNCSFCAIDKTKKNLEPVDKNEPKAIAKLSNELGLKYVVITTVTRDDLSDGGASQFIEVIKQIREICDPEVAIELLISDFGGDLDQVKRIINAGPDVLNHNIETVQRLYGVVRPMADFERSLKVLQTAKKTDGSILTKSGFMVGLGETKIEVLELLKKLRDVDVDIITIGQYMAPTQDHYTVAEYVHPDTFAHYKIEGVRMGFRLIESAPLVRSSYHAEQAKKILNK
ncbi:MAG: lipoyl synthase [Candidatus Cloacimonetes bacterium]|jgi:lipoic acid synthetase|nr:lipoyl synthase [Candidatus Cloacimonadota bacterium]